MCFHMSWLMLPDRFFATLWKAQVIPGYPVVLLTRFWMRDDKRKERKRRKEKTRQDKTKNQQPWIPSLGPLASFSLLFEKCLGPGSSQLSICLPLWILRTEGPTMNISIGCVFCLMSLVDFSLYLQSEDTFEQLRAKKMLVYANQCSWGHCRFCCRVSFFPQDLFIFIWNS